MCDSVRLTAGRGSGAAGMPAGMQRAAGAASRGAGWDGLKLKEKRFRDLGRNSLLRA